MRKMTSAQIRKLDLNSFTGSITITVPCRQARIFREPGSEKKKYIYKLWFSEGVVYVRRQRKLFACVGEMFDGEMYLYYMSNSARCLRSLLFPDLEMLKNSMSDLHLEEQKRIQWIAPDPYSYDLRKDVERHEHEFVYEVRDELDEEFLSAKTEGRITSRV